MLKMIRNNAGELRPVGMQAPSDGLGHGQRPPLFVGEQQPYLGRSGIIEKEGELLGGDWLFGAHETQVDTLFAQRLIGRLQAFGIGPCQLLQPAGDAAHVHHQGQGCP
ncbi:hypothetical protein D3C86_1334240 [compost metagenome]